MLLSELGGYRAAVCSPGARAGLSYSPQHKKSPGSRYIPLAAIFFLCIRNIPHAASVRTTEALFKIRTMSDSPPRGITAIRLNAYGRSAPERTFSIPARSSKLSPGSTSCWLIKSRREPRDPAVRSNLEPRGKMDRAAKRAGNLSRSPMRLGDPCSRLDSAAPGRGQLWPWPGWAKRSTPSPKDAMPCP
jgi:hypothetical protein